MHSFFLFRLVLYFCAGRFLFSCINEEFVSSFIYCYMYVDLDIVYYMHVYFVFF